VEASDHQFRVMASAAQVVLVDPHPGAAAAAERRLRVLEQRWSRFLPDSDISRVNSSRDSWVDVSVDTIRLIQTMKLAARATGGGYDPTFLHQLLATGYTASIDDPSRITIDVVSRSRDHTLDDVEIDQDRSRVRVPAGLSLDPGGIGKGFAADLAVTESLIAGTGGALVSVGGDIAAAGSSPTSDGWVVNVEDPHDAPAALATLAVSDGGIATSSTQSRRWFHGGVERHHIIDPDTGAASRTDLATVTVIANAGWLAEAHATAALLRGSDEAMTYLSSRGLTGIAVTRDGTVTSTSDLEATTPQRGDA
jgi:FAD:protein FMN transferase